MKLFFHTYCVVTKCYLSLHHNKTDKNINRTVSGNYMRVWTSYFNPESHFNASLDRGANYFVNFSFDCEKLTEAQVSEEIDIVDRHIQSEHFAPTGKFDTGDLYQINEERESYFR